MLNRGSEGGPLVCICSWALELREGEVRDDVRSSSENASTKVILLIVRHSEERTSSWYKWECNCFVPAAVPEIPSKDESSVDRQTTQARIMITPATTNRVARAAIDNDEDLLQLPHSHDSWSEELDSDSSSELLLWRRCGGFVRTFPGGSVRTFPGGSVRTFPGGSVRTFCGGSVRTFPGGSVRTFSGGFVRTFPVGGFGRTSPVGGFVRTSPVGGFGRTSRATERAGSWRVWL